MGPLIEENKLQFYEKAEQKQRYLKLIENVFQKL